MKHLTMFIALDDCTVENGCMYYVPGSHKWDLLPITGLAGDMNAIQSVLSDEQKEAFKPVPMTLKAGEACIHHPLMVHGSFENKSNGPRRACVLNCFADGVMSDSNLPPLGPDCDVPVIPKGAKMEGQFFPLLLDINQLE